MADIESTTAEPSGAELHPLTDTPAPLSADARHLTVGSLPAERSHRPGKPLVFSDKPSPPEMPFLRLQGRWLGRAGFPIGTKVRVLVSAKRLIIEAKEKAPERPPRLPRSIAPTDCIY